MIAVHTFRFLPAVLASAAFASLPCGCQHGADERLGLDEQHGASAFRLADVARAGDLEKALALPSGEQQRRLGGYRLVTTSRLGLSRAATSKEEPEEGRAAKRSESYEETWRLEQDAAGGTHLVHEDDRGGGMELVAVGRELYTKPRYGRYTRRPVDGDEVARASDQAAHVLASYLGVLGRFAARRDGGTVSAPGGRNARKVVLSLAPSPGSLVDGEPAHAWRRGIQVAALDGEVWLDAATGAALHATLHARYTAPRAAPGDEVQVELDLKSDVEAVGAVAAIAPPEGALPAPSRPRPLLDRQQLLDKLVTER